MLCQSNRSIKSIYFTWCSTFECYFNIKGNEQFRTGCAPDGLRPWLPWVESRCHASSPPLFSPLLPAISPSCAPISICTSQGIRKHRFRPNLDTLGLLSGVSQYKSGYILEATINDLDFYDPFIRSPACKWCLESSYLLLPSSGSSSPSVACQGLPWTTFSHGHRRRRAVSFRLSMTEWGRMREDEDP